MTTLYRGSARHVVSNLWTRRGVTRSSLPVRAYAASTTTRTDGQKKDKDVAAADPQEAPRGVPYTSLTVGVPSERRFPLERRVAASPESVARLVQPGFTVAVERGAGTPSDFSDADYQAAGATVVDDVWKDSDIVLKVSGVHIHRRITVGRVLWTEWTLACLFPG